MCNLFTVRASVSEVASHFVVEPSREIVVPAETARGAVTIERTSKHKRIDWPHPAAT